MAKMKSKEEIGKYLLLKIRALGLSQSDLAREIAELRGEGYDKNSIKDNVSKWINGTRFPGTEYIYYLAQVLKVSIEEILVAGEVCNKYEDRPFTLYAVAKSGNRDAVDKIMSLQDEYGNAVGTNYDEYDKTLLEYIIEFENLDLLHYLIEKEYVTFFENQIQTGIRIGNTYQTIFNDIVTLAIKHDDLDIFKRAIKRTQPILLFAEEQFTTNKLFLKNEYRRGYSFSTETIISILKTKKIREYLTLPFIPNDSEWQDLNGGIQYLNPNTRIERTDIRELETLSQSFNLLLNMALKIKKPIAKDLISIGQNHNFITKKQLNSLYPETACKIGSEGNVTVGHHIGSLTVFAGIDTSFYQEDCMTNILRL